MREAKRNAVAWVLDVLGAGPGCDLRAADNDAIDWHHVVAFASSQLILPALAGRIGGAMVAPPDEVGAFLDGIEARTLARNEALRAALFEIGAAFEGVSAPPIVLKGGAFLLDAMEQERCAAWRFMSDLDVLVGEAELDHAIERLEGLGFRAVEAGGALGAGHHAPPMIAPCGTYCVEPHMRLSDRDEAGLSPDEMRARAVPAGHRLLAPSPVDRLGHMIGHAQLHNRNAVVGRVVLKEIVDLQVLGRMIEIDGGLLDQIFAAPRARWAAGALVAAGQAFGVAPGYRPTSSERAWAARALHRLKWSPWRDAMAVPGDMARLEVFRMHHEAGHLRRRLVQLRRPRQLADAAGRWAYKQRQRLWA